MMESLKDKVLDSGTPLVTSELLDTSSRKKKPTAEGSADPGDVGLCVSRCCASRLEC